MQTPTTHKRVSVTETDAYTIIKVPKQPIPEEVGEVRFDTFVGMLDDTQKSPVEVEDNAYEIWRETAD